MELNHTNFAKVIAKKIENVDNKIPKRKETFVLLKKDEWIDNKQIKSIKDGSQATKIEISITDRNQSLEYGKSQIFVSQDGDDLIFTASALPAIDLIINVDTEVWGGVV